MKKERYGELKKVTGKWLKGSFKWLIKHDCGCCHIPFATTANHEVCVCLGWCDYDKDEYRIAWKIGWQTFNNAMQTDLDIDFDMPYNTSAYCDKMNAQLKAKGEYSEHNRYVEGEVYNTEELILIKPGKTTPVGYRDWNALAAFIRKTARKVAAYAKDVDPEEDE